MAYLKRVSGSETVKEAAADFLTTRKTPKRILSFRYLNHLKNRSGKLVEAFGNDLVAPKGAYRSQPIKRGRYTEEQTIAVLQEAQAGAKIEDLCRSHGISQATYYKWKQKFGGLEIRDAQRLRLLVEESRKLKKVAADQSVPNMALKELLGNNPKAQSAPLRHARSPRSYWTLRPPLPPHRLEPFLFAISNAGP